MKRLIRKKMKGKPQGQYLLDVMILKSWVPEGDPEWLEEAIWLTLCDDSYDACLRWATSICDAFNETNIDSTMEIVAVGDEACTAYGRIFLH